MALSPLTVQSPRVSLIGGKELPKASGQGVSVPDLGNAFNEMITTLGAKERQYQAIDDELQAKTDAEIYHERTKGKNPLDRYTNPPKINGSPIYRAAAQVALEANAISDIRSVYSDQAGVIQAEVGTPTEQKMARILSVGDTIVNSVAPMYRQNAREYIQADMAQREAQLRGEDSRRLEAAIADGQTKRLETAFDKGVSAAASGSDWTQHTKEIRAVFAERVASGDMLPETADAEALRISNLVVAEGFHRTIAVEAAKGNIDPADLLDFGVSVDTNVPYELFAEDQPDQIQKWRYDTGQLKKDPYHKRIISADEYRALISDPATAKAIANNIQELARHLGAKVKANEKDVLLQDFLRKSGANPTRRLPVSLQSTVEEKATQAIQQNDALNSPEGREALKLLVKATNYMPSELLNQLEAMTQGTYQEAMGALNMYNELTTGINGNVESGKIVQQSIPADTAAKFDSFTMLAADLLRQHGGDNVAIEQDWRRAMNKLADKANNEEFFADDYYAATEAGGRAESLNAAIRRISLDHYGRTNLDPQILREARAAYRNSMILSDNVSQVVALEQVMDRIFNRYTKNPIFKNGIAHVEAWENPEIEGYIAPRFTDPSTWGNQLVDPNQWVSDFTVGQLHNFLGRDQVFMSPKGMQALEAAIAAGESVPLGKTILLEPLGGDRARPQFKVLVVMEGGTSTEIVNVIGEDGRPTPLLLDPGLILSNINNRNRVGEELYKDREEYVTTRNVRILTQYGKTRGQPGTPSEVDLLNDPAVYEKWFREQDPDFRKQLSEFDISNQEFLEKSMRRYQELQNTVVPEGMEIDPKLLGTPKAIGKGVVLGAIDTVGKLFNDGQTMKQFMANVSGAETNFGNAENTFRVSGDRGLWQINDSGNGAFMEIKRRAAIPGDPMYVMAQKAKQMLGIDVAALTSSDLDKALPNALMARMYFSITQAPVPTDPEEQADYWKEHYNPGATQSMLNNFVRMAGSLVVPAAYASTGLEAGGPGMVTDIGGNAYPANFTATNRSTQVSALKLSAAFGKPLRVTPHGGRSYRASSTSQHPQGTALDIYVGDYTDAEKTRLIALAISMGYRGIGGYGYGETQKTIHLDLRTRTTGALDIWWWHSPTNKKGWTEGRKWFQDGIKQGSALKGINPSSV